MDLLKEPFSIEPHLMHINDFDYHLPPELIAQFPSPQRDTSRLLVLYRENGKIEHALFSNIDTYFEPGDMLVVNDTKVRPARILGHKETGGKVELLLLQSLNSLEYPQGKNLWEVLINCGKNPRIGSWLFFGPDLKAKVVKQKEEGLWDIQLIYEGNLDEIIEETGKTPLPPYIKRENFEQDSLDRNNYQTIFARNVGSAAAPTAGLHFTDRLIKRIQQKGVEILTITLHVGLGTFQPVRVKNIEEHLMHHEYYEVTPETAQKITRAIEKNKRIIACGTTSVRVIETLRDKTKPLRGFTNLFIYPGYAFKTIKGLITNFHLPRSTLLMLVTAFAGKELILRAYQEAIENKYRFYSYGDAMLIV